VHGVASFFVSRIDTQIDKKIDQRIKDGDPDAEALKALRGKVAIANAKVAYQDYLGLISEPRWKALAASGAQPQRLLWASTGTKDPAFSDILYVETLIGPDTINTMPPKTIDAFRDHGRVDETLTQDIEGARRVLAETGRLGLDLDGVTRDLVADGVRQFSDAADKLYAAVATRRAAALGDRLNLQKLNVPQDLAQATADVLERARAEGWGRRIWAKDKAVWTGADEDRWLGWLDAGLGKGVDLEALGAFQAEVRGAGFAHALLLGMGGSSLGPEVLAQTFGTRPGYPKLLVLDSTDPHQIRRLQAQIDPASTLFIVASKSGSTLEPDILHRYFHDLTVKAVGAVGAGAHFVAITDPGSQLEKAAQAQGFRRIFHGEPSIGGRYSVLSNFGMVPAALLGLDLEQFQAATLRMVRACGPSAPPAANPGFELGAAMGSAAKAGRDKLTVIASRGIADIGAWLEQLIAESTGKAGKGIIPVDAEPLAPARDYGNDRLFAYLRLEGPDQSELDAHVDALEDAGLPVVRIVIASRDLIGQEFFRWELATAVAGAIIGINPFDQPDVEASKVETRKLTEGYEQTGALASETPILVEDGLAVFADARNAEALAGLNSLEGLMGQHFARAAPGDYIGLLAYIDRDQAHTEALQAMRQRLLEGHGVATVLGFGPRFLHSTGQAYKGGPNSGVFLQITHADGGDLPVPGRRYGFSVVEQAQARGDFEVLAERGRRLIRVDLGADVDGGLKRLAEAVERSLP
jgi:transaldolase/glucose-6-phosphate isomerase